MATTYGYVYVAQVSIVITSYSIHYTKLYERLQKNLVNLKIITNVKVKTTALQKMATLVVLLIEKRNVKKPLNLMVSLQLLVC